MTAFGVGIALNFPAEGLLKQGKIFAHSSIEIRAMNILQIVVLIAMARNLETLIHLRKLICRDAVGRAAFQQMRKKVFFFREICYTVITDPADSSPFTEQAGVQIKGCLKIVLLQNFDDTLILLQTIVKAEGHIFF